MSDNAAPITIRYKTEITEPRAGLPGSLARAAAKQPYLAGFIGGSTGALVAFLVSPGVVDSAPAEAALLAAMVVVAWTVIFGWMRKFFEGLSMVDVEVVRQIDLEQGVFDWDNGASQLTIQNPTFQLLSRPVPAGLLIDERAAGQPWDVWVVVRADDALGFVLKSKLAAQEAADYPAITPEIEDATQEYLPPHIASPLLVLARNA